MTLATPSQKVYYYRVIQCGRKGFHHCTSAEKELQSMLKQDTGYFSGILSERMQAMKLSCRELADILAHRGYECKIRQIQRYKTGLYVPKYEVASQICQIIMVEMEGNQLEELLTASRKHAETLRKAKVTNFTILTSINPRNIHLGGDLGLNDVIEVLNNRVFELYGDQKKISDYVEALVELDLKNKLLEAKEGE